jgi:hypothetical protein
LIDPWPPPQTGRMTPRSCPTARIIESCFVSFTFFGTFVIKGLLRAARTIQGKPGVAGHPA